MFLQSLKVIGCCFKLEKKFISIIRKSKKPLLTADQQLVGEDLNENNIESRSRITRSRRGINFYDHFEGKSIEGLDGKDERFSNFIIHARDLSSNDNDLMVLEGINMIRDAIKMDATMVSLYFTKREFLQELPYSGKSIESKVYHIKYRDMIKFSNMKTAPGLMAVFRRPNPEDMLSDVFVSRKLPLTLILDNIREPGNVGTIIRTAAAFNVNKVLLTKGCVDLYNEKVLRSSMSSLLCVPTFNHLSWDVIENSLHPDCTVHYADTSSESRSTESSFPYYQHHLIDFSNQKTYGLVIGGEIDGVSDEAKNLSESSHGCSIRIPTIRDIDSLNSSVAAAIIMAEFQKRFLVEK